MLNDPTENRNAAVQRIKKGLQSTRVTIVDEKPRPTARKNPNLLTHKQHARLAKNAYKALSHAQTLAHCLPEELGSSVAESFAEGAMEAAAAAIAELAKIKCSLRIARGEKALARQNQALEFARNQLVECARFLLGSGPQPKPESMAAIIGICEGALKEGGEW